MATRDKLWDSGHDETVEVNQRALIDKVLARYSGEFTVFRELLQNSDDAQSKAVEIHFLSKGSSHIKEENRADGSSAIPDLRTILVNQWVFKNNGILFRDEDWSRLKKIAEGNPDEQKIGAFGVGFYSLFSVTEEPFVTSGDQWMGFYWKDRKDQLFARRGKLDENNRSSWTSFEMDLREPSPIPSAFDFIRFLASSITFMTYLEQISVYFDDWCLAKLTKSVGYKQLQEIPKALSRTTPSGYMTMNGLRITPVTIHAEVMNCVYMVGTEKPKLTPPKPIKPSHGSGGFFSSLFSSITGSSTPQRASTPLPPPVPRVDPRKTSRTHIVLRIYSAEIGVRLPVKLSAEIQRSTKKNMPSTMQYELIYTAKDEYDASRKEDEENTFATGSVFQGLRADLDGTGSARIFIGHATAQTTGIGGHMAARFIPTVEREAIDFMDRNVAVWNRELLYMGGLLARAAYQLEIVSIQDIWELNLEMLENKSLPDMLRSSLIEKAIHTLKFCTFHASTPSSEVSVALEGAFFNCDSSSKLLLISTLGIREVSQIRIPDPAFTFLRQLPLLPDTLMTEPMVLTLQNKGMVKMITFQDVLSELRARPLPEADMVACMKWWISIYNEARLDAIRPQLLEAALIVVPDATADDKIIPLHTIRTVLNQRVLNGLPPNGPLPIHLLPVSISTHFSLDDLKHAFPWTDLTIELWLSHLCDASVRKVNTTHDIESSPTWAETVLSFIARNWNNGIPIPAKEKIIRLLAERTCIPTSAGMKRPSEAYFSSADIFHDLPIVQFPSGTTVKGPLERLLQILDVRKHVELQIVFNRMIKTNEWTINDLTRYLVSVKSSLKEEELERLRLTAAFPKEFTSTEDKTRIQRVRADQLYEPLPTFRELQLPIIDWGLQTKWRSNSDEAQFLFSLGLRRYPPLQDLIQLCANPDTKIRKVALKYLVDNINSKYTDYDPDNFRDLAFIPTLTLEGTNECLGPPSQVFAKHEWSHLGFLVLHPSVQDNAAKLKIKEHPPTRQLLELVQKRQPETHEVAQKWFSVLSSRVSDFSRSELLTLSETAFVPVSASPSGSTKTTVKWLTPTRCYLGQQTQDKFHSKLFVFVNFGTAGNAFLTACGAKQEPSVEEVARVLLENPHHFYELAQGPQNFLNELRNIAVNRKNLSNHTITRLKKVPALLCYQRKIAGNKAAKQDTDDLEEDEWEVGYDLKVADQIIIADDTNAHQVFSSQIFTAPQEDIIEALYLDLGSRRLSSIVKEEYILGNEIANSKRAPNTRKLILERLPIFLHEHNHARTKVSLEWLQNDGNFRVTCFGQIKVKKSLTYRKLYLEKNQEASAVARRSTSRGIELILADNAEIDMYEVAMCLNRFIFDSPKAHDALLFMTILSTDLRALKRRGYNVDRILRQRTQEKQVEEARVREEHIKLLSQEQQKLSGTNEKQALPPIPGTSALAPDRAPATGTQTMFDKLKQRVNVLGGSGSDRGQLSSDYTSIRDTGGMPGGFLGGILSQRTNGPGVTPLSNIASNIDMAIKACQPEASNLLHNRQEMQHVKEIDNDGYCDISGHAQNMRSIGSMGNVKIFVAQDVSGKEAQDILSQKPGVIARLIHIMTSLARVYGLDLTMLHIFYDNHGSLIAFNRNGSIFLNLRYYEAWHDSEVCQGKQENALISWYFTLAHEIAHNLVQPHNSEHEFYFSAICEKYLLSFCKIMSHNETP